MKLDYFAILVFLITGLQAQAQHSLDITVTGLKDKGVIYLGLYNSPIDFLEEAGMYKHVVQNISAKDNRIQFKNLPKGEYALSFYIDVNDNKEMDYNFLGMPKEPYGFYTDPGIIFSKPKFKDVSFELKESLTIEMVAK